MFRRNAFLLNKSPCPSKMPKVFAPAMQICRLGKWPDIFTRGMSDATCMSGPFVRVTPILQLLTSFVTFSIPETDLIYAENP